MFSFQKTREEKRTADASTQTANSWTTTETTGHVSTPLEVRDTKSRKSAALSSVITHRERAHETNN